MALVAELVLGGTPLVVYDVHLESKADDDLRLWQLSEVVHDSCRYSANTPVVVAGDLNTSIAPSPLEQYLLAAGFRDACEGHRRGGTKPDGRRLDWIFVRGPARCFDTRVHRDTTASDHYPMSTNLTLEHRERPQ
jgi:endonuclease/exonuclease/phosphatase family metal-dependent hydrolase